MNNTWRIGSLFDIPLYIDSSWLIILVLMTIANTSEVQANLLFAESGILGWLTGLVMALLLFASVLLHELGHSLVAKAQGINVNSITLFLFGGVATIESEPKTPWTALLVAIAGPGVSLLLWGLFSALTLTLPNSSLGQFLSLDLARLNGVLVLFNLLPGLPLDGGQVLKALVWQISGNNITGTRWAAWSGLGLGSIGIIGGILLALLLQALEPLWLSFIGGFMFRTARSYQKLSQMQSSLLELVAADGMFSSFVIVNPKTTVQEFIETYLWQDFRPTQAYFVTSETGDRGLITVPTLQKLERSTWTQTTLGEIAHPLTATIEVNPQTPLATVINQLETQQLPWLTVISTQGEIVGIIDRSHLVQTISLKLGLTIPPQEIERLNTEATFSPDFPLDRIAKTINL